MKYQLRKQETVDAQQWHRGDPWPEGQKDVYGHPVILTRVGDSCSFVTGLHHGCWIVTDSRGVMRVWTSRAFRSTYTQAGSK